MSGDDKCIKVCLFFNWQFSGMVAYLMPGVDFFLIYLFSNLCNKVIFNKNHNNQ